MFEAFLNKNVRILQTDNFTKYGFVESVSGGFISLRFDDGRLEMIREERVLTIGEVNG